LTAPNGFAAPNNNDRDDMQLPTPPGSSLDLESAVEKLDISRDHHHHRSPQPRSPSEPHPHHHQTQRTQQLPVSREASGSGPDQHHGNQAGSSNSGQLGGVLKTSHEEVWYLKSIDFTSPSGVTRTFNVITQNYNGYVFHSLRDCIL
jgi:hypothetical protein